MTKIACIGEAMIELSMSGDNAAQVGVAGDTLNTAIYLKRAAPSLDVDYVTALGDDPFSQKIHDFIASEDLGTTGIRTIEGGSPGLYAITTDDEGERTFTYWRNSSAARQLFSDGDFSILKGYDLVYLSGISLAILPDKVRQNLLGFLKAENLTLGFDSNFRPRLWESHAVARGTIAAYWDAAQIALPSIDDEMAIFGETETETEARWRIAGANGALKRGPSGPMSIGSDVAQTYKPATNVVDTTAAGDSFNGGYLAAAMTGSDQATSLKSGHDLAAKVVQARGAIIPKELM